MSAPSHRGRWPPSPTIPARSPFRSAVCTTWAAPRTTRSVASVAGPAGCGYVSTNTTTSAARSVNRSRHVQAAAAGAHRPVHRAELVARHVGANVGGLDARADVPGEVGTQAVEHLGPRIGVGCGGVNGNTKTSATSTVAVPASSPPGADDVDAGPDGYRPQRCADSRNAFAPRRSRSRAPRSACPPTAYTVEFDLRRAGPQGSACGAHTCTRACSFSKQRCESGSRTHRGSSVPGAAS